MKILKREMFMAKSGSPLRGPKRGQAPLPDREIMLLDAGLQTVLSVSHHGFEVAPGFAITNGTTSISLR
jgi:hypothetical protein